MNGRKGADAGIGQYTCIKWNGKSMVDYLLVSDEIYNIVCEFEISVGVESDHLPIVSSLYYHRNLKNDERCVVAEIPVLPKIKWKDNFRDEYFEKLNSDDSVLQQIKISCVNLNVNEAVAMLNSTVRNCACKMICKHRDNNGNSSCNHTWFEDDCRLAKNEAKRLLRSLQKNDDDEGIALTSTSLSCTASRLYTG